jgi:hypothetical protein
MRAASPARPLGPADIAATVAEMRGGLTFTVRDEGPGLWLSFEDAMKILGALRSQRGNANADEAFELFEIALRNRDEVRAWPISAVTAPPVADVIDALAASGQATDDLRKLREHL